MRHSLIARRWMGRQTLCWSRLKPIHFSRFGPELFRLLLGPRGSTGDSLLLQTFNWCCLTSQRSPVARQHVAAVESSSLILHGTLCDLFVYRDDSLTS